MCTGLITPWNPSVQDALRKLLPFNEDIEAAIAETEGQLTPGADPVFDLYQRVSVVFLKWLACRHG